MQVHLVDGTFELFRAYYGAPASSAPDGREIGATRSFLRSLWGLLARDGATHVGCAFDHVIESFRNDLFPGYKTGDGIEPELWGQAELVERAAEALGVVVWSMVEFEADDAIATAAARFAREPEVERVVICSPDKDFAQCVENTRVVLWDRLRSKTYDDAGVREKWGIPPASIPDWLALVGDTADGVPGIPKWGAKSAAAVLSAYRNVEAIPDDEKRWTVPIRGAAALGENLRTHRAELSLYKELTTLRRDVPLPEALEDMRWRGADHDKLAALCAQIGDDEFPAQITRWR